MRKPVIIILIILDLCIMGAAGAFLLTHVTAKTRTPVAAAPVPKAPPSPPVAASPSATPGTVTPPSIDIVTSAHTDTPAAPTGDAGATAGTRKIGFSYHNGKAKQVFIRADFTGWKAEAMNKDARGMWVYQASLTPGEYAYCYTVDDKTFRDPANKRTKQIGRTLVSSVLVTPPPLVAGH